MRYSRTFKSSTQCLPSPDGAFIATIVPSKLTIRTTRSLDIARVVTLPSEIASSISWFLWSQSSTRVLVASPNNIRVYSATNPHFSANITNPTSAAIKVTCVAFGATEDEICVFTDFGLKLSIVNLITSKSVDIASPKLYHSVNASKGFAYRPGTNNLTLLSRGGGKDIISIHAQGTHAVTRSWNPDTIDSQGLVWSADGRWLVVLESAAHGHKFFVYTADGHLFKTWNGPRPFSILDTDIELGPGIKMFDWNHNGGVLAIGDQSKRVTILSTPSFTESLNVQHTASVTPTDTLQVWQEQILPSLQGRFQREFVPAVQYGTICPPTSTPTASINNSETKTGTNMMTFDNSGTLLATRTESMPTTLWIWDIKTRLLRAVMIFHAPVAKITWHPTINELIMIRCEESRGIAHLWEPSWEKPRIINFAQQVPGGKVIGKTVAKWLNSDCSGAAMLFSDTQDCLLASFSEEGDGDIPWQDSDGQGVSIYGQRMESPFNLGSLTEKKSSKMKMEALADEDSFTRMSSGSGSGSEEIDDTFHFRRGIEVGDSWT